MTVSAGTHRVIVVGVDASPMSVEALQWADAQSRRTGAGVIAVLSWHVPMPGVELVVGVADATDAAAELLDDTVRQALEPGRADLVEQVVASEPPAQALLSRADNAELIVIGPHSNSIVPGRHLGSVPHRVLDSARCPVLVVRASAPRERRIVVGVDGSPGGRAALRWAVAQAEREAAPLEAVIAWEWHPQYGVFPFGPTDAEVHELAGKALHAELAELTETQRQLVEPRVEHGHPAHVLCERAAAAHLLVVGRRGLSAAPVGDLMGSVSSTCVRRSSAPVVVVHPSTT